MPDNVGRYRILRPLGRGGMGLVYLAEDPVLNRQVAIKMLDLSVEDGSRREFLRERLLRDARAAAILSHPNIVDVHDVIQEGDTAYIVMEYLAGESLSAYLKKNPAPQPAFILQVLRQMAGALDYTHGKGVIHRDIKPGNVMVIPGGAVKILDFGVARLSDVRTTTPTGMVMGTVEYMAPEQIKGEPVDGRADQFSLAAVAYQMLTGSTLFGEHTLATLTYKMVNEMPPLVRTRNAALPAAVDTIITKALAKSPSERYRTCSEFIEALGRAFSGGLAVSSRPAAEVAPTQTLAVPASAPPAKAGKPIAPAWLAAGASVLILAGALAIWQPWRRSVAPSASGAGAATSPTEQPPLRVPERRAEAPRPVTGSARVARTEPRRETAKSGSLARTEIAQQPARPNELPPSETPDRPDPAIAPTYRQGQEQMKNGDYQAAIQSFTTVISRRPNEARAYHNRGLCHQLLGQNEEAIKDFSEAVRLDPKAAASYSDRGVCLVRMRQDEPAFADFSRALELRPDLAPALNGRGGIFLRRRQYDQAIRDFTDALRINPQFAQAYHNRALARRAMGDNSGAEADLKAEVEVREGKN